MSRTRFFAPILLRVTESNVTDFANCIECEHLFRSEVIVYDSYGYFGVRSLWLFIRFVEFHAFVIILLLSKKMLACYLACHACECGTDYCEFVMDRGIKHTDARAR